MRVLMILALTAFLAVPAFAAFEGPGGAGGFQGPGTTAPTTTVAQAKNMADDAIVTLTGNVVSKVTGKKDKYVFRDATGEMIIEIDHKRFRGQTVTPADTVRITGEVDKDFGRAAKIDVKMLEVVK